MKCLHQTSFEKVMNLFELQINSPIEIYPFSIAIGTIIFLEEVDLCQPLLKVCIRSIYYVKENRFQGWPQSMGPIGYL